MKLQLVAILFALTTAAVAGERAEVRDKNGSLLYTVVVSGNSATIRDRNGALVATERKQSDGTVIVRDRNGTFVAKVKPKP